jgi:hypothetical protein
MVQLNLQVSRRCYLGELDRSIRMNLFQHVFQDILGVVSHFSGIASLGITKVPSASVPCSDFERLPNI